MEDIKKEQAFTPTYLSFRPSEGNVLIKAAYLIQALTMRCHSYMYS